MAARSQTDAELVADLRSGERRALTEAYDRYRVALFGFLCRLCADRRLAEDLFQNTWVKLAREGSKLRPDSDLRAWLFTVARNEYRSYRRWQRLDVTRLLAFAQAAPEPVVEAPARDAHELERALQLLSASDREVLLLVSIEGFDPTAAATVLGVSPETLRQRLSRARKRLTRILDAEDKVRSP